MSFNFCLLDLENGKESGRTKVYVGHILVYCLLLKDTRQDNNGLITFYISLEWGWGKKRT